MVVHVGEPFPLVEYTSGMARESCFNDAALGTQMTCRHNLIVFLRQPETEMVHKDHVAFVVHQIIDGVGTVLRIAVKIRYDCAVKICRQRCERHPWLYCRLLEIDSLDQRWPEDQLLLHVMLAEGDSSPSKEARI